jgi:hypothetical protein
MRAAMGALEFLAIGDAMEGRVHHTASDASVAKAEPDLHNVLKANILIRELLEKLPDGQLAGGMVLVHVNNLVYTAVRVNRIIYMAVDFIAATDALFAKTGPEDLAGELGCSAQTIRQARMDTEKPGHRSPPPGWEVAAAKLARQKAVQLQKLADRLG